MRINKRVHPIWLEKVKYIMIIPGLCFLLFAMIFWLSSDNIIFRIFLNQNILLSIAKYLMIVGGGMTVIGICAVSVEHWLCRVYCIGWENHNLTR